MGTLKRINHDSKYWDMRYDIFDRFDDGILMDDEAMYSTKPQKSAFEIAKLFKAKIVADVYCGVGGVSIALATLGKKVIANDKYKRKINMAEHNSQIYNVSSKIEFKKSDAKSFINKLPQYVEGIYIDPPWGGPSYTKRKLFSFDNFKLDDWDIISFIKFSEEYEIIISVPNNFDFNEIKKLGRDFSIFNHILKDRNLFYSVYFPKS